MFYFLRRSKEWVDPDVVATSLGRLEVEHRTWESTVIREEAWDVCLGYATHTPIEIKNIKEHGSMSE